MKIGRYEIEKDGGTITITGDGYTTVVRETTLECVLAATAVAHSDGKLRGAEEIKAHVTEA